MVLLILHSWLQEDLLAAAVHTTHDGLLGKNNEQRNKNALLHAQQLAI